MKYYLKFLSFITLVLPCNLYAANISITEQVTMDFANLAIPSSGSENLNVPSSGGGATGTGTIVSGTTSRGQYKLKRTGNNPATINIDIQNITTGSSEITLDSFEGTYNGASIPAFPAGGLPEPGKGQGTPLYLGAKVTYSNLVAEGVGSMSFDLVVIFE